MSGNRRHAGGMKSAMNNLKKMEAVRMSEAPLPSSKLRVIEPLRMHGFTIAEVFVSSIGLPHALALTLDTEGGEEATATLTAKEAHDLMLWLQCALNDRKAVETSAESHFIGWVAWHPQHGFELDEILDVEAEPVNDMLPGWKWVKAFASLQISAQKASAKLRCTCNMGAAVKGHAAHCALSTDDPAKVKCIICGKLRGEHTLQELADCSATENERNNV